MGLASQGTGKDGEVDGKTASVRMDEMKAGGGGISYSQTLESKDLMDT